MNDQSFRTVVYLARTREPLGDAELEELLVDAREYNRAHGVTGVLLVCDGEVMQNLEGPAEGVSAALDRIRASRRIVDFTIVLDNLIPKRCFADWDMGVGRTTRSEMLDLSSARWSALANEDRPVDRVCRGLRQLRNFWERHRP
ncbi:MAG: BLUF domain-containing protein [Armatimonadota bacterium]